MDELSRRARERLTREEAIVAAAEKAFISKGFDEASMAEIARQAQFTKRTLYRYFRSKEDLYFGVVLKSFRMMVTYLADAGEGAPDGFQRIRKVFRALCGFCREYPESFRFISQRGHMIKRSADQNPSREELDGINSQLFARIAEVLQEGIADGSIRPGLKVDQTVFSIVFLVTGFLTQLSTTGESFTTKFRLDIEEFCNSTIDMVLGTLAPVAASRSLPEGTSI